MKTITNLIKDVPIPKMGTSFIRLVIVLFLKHKLQMQVGHPVAENYNLGHGWI